MSALVVRGRLEALSEVPFHHDGPLTRWLMAGKTLDPPIGVHIAVHEFDHVDPASRSYCLPHVHDHDELDIFHSATALVVELMVGEETIVVEAPAAVRIPAGTRHAVNVHSGSGTMTTILLSADYHARG